MTRILCIIVLLATLTAGCASSGSLSHEMASLQGADVDAVIAAWGPPETETVMAGQRVLVWTDRSPGYYEVEPDIVICERVLALDDAGTVTGWRWRGDACELVHQVQRAAPGISAVNVTR